MSTLHKTKKSSADDTGRDGEFQLQNAGGFYTCPYRPKCNVEREKLRNQYGKAWIKRNGGKLPSLNQMKNAVILVNMELMRE